MNAEVIENNKYKMGFINYFAIDKEGRNGGIALMWGSDLKVSK